MMSKVESSRLQKEDVAGPLKTRSGRTNFTAPHLCFHVFSTRSAVGHGINTLQSRASCCASPTETSRSHSHTITAHCPEKNQSSSIKQTSKVSHAQIRSKRPSRLFRRSHLEIDTYLPSASRIKVSITRISRSPVYRLAWQVSSRTKDSARRYKDSGLRSGDA